VTCPKAKHFHVICNGVFEKENFNKIFEVSDPNTALEKAILELPDSWEGAIEVSDDSALGNQKFPLIDFWRTPI
jgi:hypothetical protein